MPVVVLDHLAPYIFDEYQLFSLPWDCPPKTNKQAVNETLAQYSLHNTRQLGLLGSSG